MNAGHGLAAVLLFASSALLAQTVLTSDVGVTLAAIPTTNLTPGQPTEFTMTVTNYGPDDIPIVEVTSSLWTNQITPLSFNQNECHLVVSVLDGATPAYFMSWIIAGLPGQPVFAVGQSLTCHFSLTITAFATTSTEFSFGLPSFITDTNPSNDVGSVTLQRAPAAPPTPVPTLSPGLLFLLAGLMVAYGTRCAQKRNQMHST